MKIRKIICLLITVMLCVSLCFGCSNSLPEEPNIPEQPDTPDVPIEPDIPEPEIKLTSLKIGDRDISEYTIVVGDNPFRFNEDIEYDIPANAFAKEIYDRLGITLKVEKFSFEAEYGPTIVFGNNYERKTVKPYYKEYKEKRQKGTEAEDFVLFNEFGIFAKDDNIYVLSGSVQSTELTVGKFFNDYVMSFCSAENGDVVLDADFSFTGSNHVYTIGCIGDSITWGAGATDILKTYPVLVQNLLGYEKYQVVNFGCCAMTMCTNHKDAYVECMQYKNLIKNAAEIDMAIIWLGTNDADRFKDNWSEAVDEDYLASYRDLLSRLKTANPDMKIILLNPCYCAIDYWEASIEAHVLSLVDQISEETGYPMFDMHSYTQNAFGESDFADKLHPSDSGYVIVAEKVAELIHQYE